MSLCVANRTDIWEDVFSLFILLHIEKSERNFCNVADIVSLLFLQEQALFERSYSEYRASASPKSICFR